MPVQQSHNFTRLSQGTHSSASSFHPRIQGLDDPLWLDRVNALGIHQIIHQQNKHQELKTTDLLVSELGSFVFQAFDGPINHSSLQSHQDLQVPIRNSSFKESYPEG